MSKPSLKKTIFFTGIVVIIGMASITIVGIFLGGNQSSRTIDFPEFSDWQVTSENDDLVRGLCFGSASECGAITREYSTSETEDEAVKSFTEVVTNEGWTIQSSTIVRSETQIVARKNSKLIYAVIGDDNARIKYEENHQTKE